MRPRRSQPASINSSTQGQRTACKCSIGFAHLEPSRMDLAVWHPPAAPNFVPDSAECFGWNEGCLRVGALLATRCEPATKGVPDRARGWGTLQSAISKQCDNESASLHIRTCCARITGRRRSLTFAMRRRGPISRGSWVAGAGDGEGFRTNKHALYLEGNSKAALSVLDCARQFRVRDPKSFRRFPREATELRSV